MDSIQKWDELVKELVSFYKRRIGHLETLLEKSERIEDLYEQIIETQAKHIKVLEGKEQS